MKKLFLILLNFYFLSVFAQKFPVEGHVMDTSGQPVPYAAIRLVHNKEIKKYTMADSTGVFHFPKVPSGTYLLFITQVGYQDYQQTITVSQPIKDLKIRLQPQAENLQAVEITVRRTVEVQPDAIRLNVAGTSLANEPDLTRVLRYAPNVTFINGLQVLGSNRIILRIDGRKIEAGADKIADYLQRLKPENIRYIEIRDAGDAETAGGQAAEIIIRTTKTLGISFIPSASFLYRSAPAYDGGAELYYTKGKFRYWMNFFVEHAHSLSDAYRQTFLDNDITYTDTSHTSLIRQNFGLTLGTDFYQNDRTTIGFFYDYYSDTDKNFNKESLTHIQTPVTNDSLIHTQASFNHLDSEHLWHVYYEKYTDTLDSYWRLSTEYFRSRFQSPGQTAQDFYSDDTLVTRYLYDNRSDSHYDIYGSEWIREKNTISGATWKTGLKFTRTFWYYNYDETIHTDTHTFRHLSFQLREDILAPYINYEAGKGRWKWSLGLRVEWTNYAFGEQDYGLHNQVVPVLPNLKITYQNGQKHYAYLYFTHKIRRPSYFLYNPAEQVSDRLNVFKGNPGLRPVDIWRGQAVYFFRRRYAVMLRYDYNTNNILNVTTYDEDTGRTRTRPINTGIQHHWILLVNFPFKIRNGWTTQTKFYYSYKTFSAPELNRNIVSYYPGITQIHRIDLFPGATMEINLEYTGKYNYLNSVYEPVFVASTYVYFGLMNNRLKAFLNFYDLFDTQHTQYTSYLPDRTIQAYSKYNSRSIGIGLRYIFRKFDEPDEYTPDPILEQEKKRIQK